VKKIVGRHFLRSVLRQYLRSTKGSNLIEFAIIAPIFLTIIIGIFDFGAMMIVQTSLDAGARAASRFGLTGASGGSTRSAAIQNEILKTVAAYSGGIADPNKLVITVDAFPNLTALTTNNGTFGSYGTGGQVVQYTIAYKWNTFLGSFGFPSPITLSGIAVVQNENF
jgi:Flp pilus assembly protein TadG